MRVKFVRLQNFRNVGFSEADLDAQSVWISGANAQGKTNLLEAAGLLNAFRSFRTSQLNSLIKFGEKQASVLMGVSHEIYGDCEVRMEISSAQKKIFIGGEEQKRLSDFIGKFPALALCSEDMLLLRGSPSERRKFADLTISSIDADYFECLKRYHAALAQRNALLKQEDADGATFVAFETDMASSARVVYQKRQIHLERLADIAGEKYRILAGVGAEEAFIKLKSDCEIPTEAAYLEILAAERDSDRERGHTSSGPHRDDFQIFISGKAAKQYASEGQQRSLVLSLKLAQFALLEQKGVRGVLLCDDILGELDARRRAAFWSCIDPETQVIATSTENSPEGGARRNWKTLRVSNGSYSAA